MTNLVLVIGSKRFSSWSLRPWLALKQAGLPFDEIIINLRQADRAEKIAAYSPSGKVPALLHGALTLWDSLAICEYVAELARAHPLWPENRGARAVARSVSAEMHSGFAALRQHLPMDVGQFFPGFQPPPDAVADIRRVQALWQDCRTRYGGGGDFLFGPWSLADAMFAPVVYRFKHYHVALDPVCHAYIEASLALPAMREWVAGSIDDA